MIPGFPNFRMGDFWLRSQKNRRSQDCMAVFLPAFPLLSLLSFIPICLPLLSKKRKLDTLCLPKTTTSPAMISSGCPKHVCGFLMSFGSSNLQRYWLAAKCFVEPRSGLHVAMSLFLPNLSNFHMGDLWLRSSKRQHHDRWRGSAALCPIQQKTCQAIQMFVPRAFSRPKMSQVVSVFASRRAFARLLQLFKKVSTLRHGVHNPIVLLNMCPESGYSTCILTKADQSKTKRLENTVYTYSTQCYGHISRSCFIGRYKTSSGSSRSFFLLPCLHWFSLRNNVQPADGIENPKAPRSCLVRWVPRNADRWGLLTRNSYQTLDESNTLTQRLMLFRAAVRTQTQFGRPYAWLEDYKTSSTSSPTFFSLHHSETSVSKIPITSSHVFVEPKKELSSNISMFSSEFKKRSGQCNVFRLLPTQNLRHTMRWLWRVSSVIKTPKIKHSASRGAV